jgi:hypothetical protein
VRRAPDGRVLGNGRVSRHSFVLRIRRMRIRERLPGSANFEGRSAGHWRSAEIALGRMLEGLHGCTFCP